MEDRAFFHSTGLLVDIELTIPATADPETHSIQTLLGLYSFSKLAFKAINEYAVVSSAGNVQGNRVKKKVHFKGISQELMPTALMGVKWIDHDLCIVIRVLYVDTEGCDVLAIGALPLVAHNLAMGGKIEQPVPLFASPEGLHISDYIVHSLAGNKSEQLVRANILQHLGREHTAIIKIEAARPTKFLDAQMSQSVSVVSRSLGASNDRKGRDDVVVFLELRSIPEGLTIDDSKCLDVHLSLISGDKDGKQETEITENCLRYASGAPCTPELLLRAIWMPPPHSASSTQAQVPFWTDTFSIDANVLRRNGAQGQNIYLLVTVHQRHSQHEDYPVGTQRIALFCNNRFSESLVHADDLRVSTDLDILMHDIEDVGQSHTSIGITAQLISSKTSTDKYLNSIFDFDSNTMRTTGSSKAPTFAAAQLPLTKTNFSEIALFAYKIFQSAIHGMSEGKELLEVNAAEHSREKTSTSFITFIVMCAACEFSETSGSAQEIADAFRSLMAGMNAARRYAEKLGGAEETQNASTKTTPAFMRLLSLCCRELVRSPVWKTSMKVGGDLRISTAEEADHEINETVWPARLCTYRGLPEAIRLGWPNLVEITVAMIQGSGGGIGVLTSAAFISELGDMFESLGAAMQPYLVDPRCYGDVYEAYVRGSLHVLRAFEEMGALDYEDENAPPESPLYGAIFRFLRGALGATEKITASMVDQICEWISEPFLQHVISRAPRDFADTVMTFMERFYTSNPKVFRLLENSMVLDNLYASLKWKDIYDASPALFDAFLTQISTMARADPEKTLVEGRLRKWLREILYVLIEVYSDDDDNHGQIDVFCALGRLYIALSRSCYGPMDWEDILCIKAFYSCMKRVSMIMTPIGYVPTMTGEPGTGTRVSTPSKQDRDWAASMIILCGDVDHEGCQAALLCLRQRIQSWRVYYDTLDSDDTKTAFLDAFVSAYASLPEKLAITATELFHESRYTSWFKPWRVHGQLQQLIDGLGGHALASKLPLHKCLLIFEYYGLVWVRTIDMAEPNKKLKALEEECRLNQTQWTAIKKALGGVQKLCDAYPAWSVPSSKRVEGRRSSLKLRKLQRPIGSTKFSLSVAPEILHTPTKDDSKEDDDDDEADEDLAPLREDSFSGGRIYTGKRESMTESLRSQATQNTTQPVVGAAQANSRKASTVNPLLQMRRAKEAPKSSPPSATGERRASMQICVDGKWTSVSHLVNPTQVTSAFSNNRKEGTVNPITQSADKINERKASLHVCVDGEWVSTSEDSNLQHGKASIDTRKQSVVNPLMAARAAAEMNRKQSVVNPLMAARSSAVMNRKESVVNPLMAARMSQSNRKESVVNPLAMLKKGNKSPRSPRKSMFKSSERQKRKSVMDALAAAKSTPTSRKFAPPPRVFRAPPSARPQQEAIIAGPSEALKFARSLDVFMGPADADILLSMIKSKQGTVKGTTMTKAGQVNVDIQITEASLKVVDEAGTVYHDIPMSQVLNVQESPAPYALMVFTSDSTIYLSSEKRGVVVGCIRGLKKG
jgi:hypothetical protein